MQGSLREGALLIAHSYRPALPGGADTHQGLNLITFLPSLYFMRMKEQGSLLLPFWEDF